jgi:hypothetical protein
MATPPAEKGTARQLAGDDAGAPKKLGAAPQAPGGAGLAAEGALRAPARSTAYKADTATANAAPAGGSSQGNNRMDFSTAKPTADRISLKAAAAPKAPPPPATAAPGRVEANGKIWANRDEGATAPAPAAEQLTVGGNLAPESTPTPSKPAPQTDALKKRAVPAEALEADASTKAKDTRLRREARAGESKEAEAAKAENQTAIRSPATLTVTGAGRLAVMKVVNELGARTPDKTRKEESLKKAKTDITDVVTVLIPREKYAELLARLGKIGKVTVEPARPAADEKAVAVGAGAAPAVAAADIRADSDAGAFITVHIQIAAGKPSSAP